MPVKIAMLPAKTSRDLVPEESALHYVGALVDCFTRGDICLVSMLYPIDEVRIVAIKHLPASPKTGFIMIEYIYPSCFAKEVHDMSTVSCCRAHPSPYSLIKVSMWASTVLYVRLLGPLHNEDHLFLLHHLVGL